MGELLRLPATQLINGLERMEKEGITANLWHRLRLDERFGENVFKFALEENKRNPGKRSLIRVPKDWTRGQWVKALKEANLGVMAEAIMYGLSSRANIGSDVRSYGHSHESHFEEEAFRVWPGRRLTEEQAREEMAQRGVVPAGAEEAFAYALTGDVPYGGQIVALDAQYEGEMLSITHDRDDRRFLSLVRIWSDRSFHESICFLGVRPIPRSSGIRIS